MENLSTSFCEGSALVCAFTPPCAFGKGGALQCLPTLHNVVYRENQINID